MGSKLKRKEFAEEHTKELCGFRKMLGLIKVPFLRDPNTNVELFESSKIVKYLQVGIWALLLPVFVSTSLRLNTKRRQCQPSRG